jgi:hypothetical protein
MAGMATPNLLIAWAIDRNAKRKAERKREISIYGRLCDCGDWDRDILLRLLSI